MCTRFLCVLWLAMAVQAWAQNTVFQNSTATQVADILGPVLRVGVADLTGDGKPDVVAGTEEGISVLAGSGPMQFQMAKQLWSGCQVWDFAIADFNRDGIPDLAADCPTDNALFILQGERGGGLRASSRLSIKTMTSAGDVRAWGVAAADLNQDGLIDLAAAQDQSLALFTGNGDGTFTRGAEPAVGEYPTNVVIADLNGDRVADLAVATERDVSVLLGTGRGAFQPEAKTPMGESAIALATGDFNKDGKADFAVGCRQRVTLLIGNGDGTFRHGTTAEQANRPVSIETGDLNGDAVTDVIVGNYYDGTISVLLCSSDGTLREMTPVPSIGDVYWVALSDLNGDAKLDLVAASASSETVLAAAGRGNGEFDGPAYFGRVALASSVLRSADVDANGKADLAVVMPLRKSAQFLRRGSEPLGLSTFDGYPMDALLGDLTGDGLPDLAVVSLRVLWGFPGGDCGAEIQVLPGRRDGTFATPVKTTVERCPISSSAVLPRLTLGDFNGDGVPDIALLNGPLGAIELYAGRGDGAFNRIGVLVGQRPLAVRFTDLDGDRYQDLIVAYDGSVTVNYGWSAGFAKSTTSSTCRNPNYLLTGNFGGDSKLDVAVGCAFEINILVNGGDGRFQAAQKIPLEADSVSSLRAMTAADFDGDGRDDLLAIFGPYGRFGQLLLGKGDGTFRQAGILIHAHEPMAVVAENWDDDGRPDLAVVNVGNGAVELMLNAVASGTPSALVSVSAASLTLGPLAPSMITSAFGEGLSSVTEVATTASLPRTLAGTTVIVNDSEGREQAVPLFFVSPGQINFLVPADVRPGTAAITFSRDGRAVAQGLKRIASVAPSIFTANADGKGVPAALSVRVRGDGSQSSEPVFRCASGVGSCVATPIDLGEASEKTYLMLFGTGIRGCSLAYVNADIGGVKVPVLGVAAQGQYQGLDQVNVELPRQLIGKGEVDVNINACSSRANPVRIHVR